jgi:hypothetical protein
VDLPAAVSGGVEIRKFTVPEFSIENLRYAIQGRYCVPGEYTMMLRDNELWMSDTTAEARDHFSAYCEMKRRGGRILIVGLGLGMIVKKALELPNVTHVDVVEIDPDVVTLVGPSYESERCTIHLGDIHDMKWPKGTHWSVAWFDIWPTIGDDHLPEMTRLARSYGRRADWKGFWGKDEALRMQREWIQLVRQLTEWQRQQAL